MITSLITGGAGFIGSHVAKHCLALNHRVIILDDFSGGFEENIPEGAELIKGSINDVALLTKIFESNTIDYVYHLAAYAAEGLSHFIRNFNYNNNLIGSINLINLSINHKIRCFVFTSSIAVYGAGQLPMSEDMTPRPEDPYGIAKYAVELDLESAHRLFGLNSIIFRPHNVYGENQNVGDRYRNVIGIFMNQLMNNQNLTVFGDGEQSRAFSYIDDVAPIIANSVNVKEAYNNVFNVGADTPSSVNKLLTIIAKEFNVEPSITYCEARNEVTHAYCSHKKLNEIFPNQKQTDIETGIRRMAAWAKIAGAQKSNVFSNIEILENLPPIWKTS